MVIKNKLMISQITDASQTARLVNKFQSILIFLLQNLLLIQIRLLYTQHSILSINSIIFCKMTTKFKYNPFRIPSSHSLARCHRAASTASSNDGSELQVCGCCLMPINKAPISINFNMADLAHLSFEYRSLYDYVKVLIVLLIAIVFDSGISQFQDTLGKTKWNNAGISSLIGSWTSLSPDYPQAKFWMYSTLSFISLGIFLMVARIVQTYRLRNMFSSYEGQECWAILLKNIPKTPNVEQNVRDLFKTNFNQLQIREIILLPDMNSYTEAKKQIIKQVDNWRQLLKTEDKKKQEILQSLKSIESANKNLFSVKEEIARNSVQIFCGNCIVVFERREDQEEVLKAWKSKFFTKNKIGAAFGIVDGNAILVEEAPSPSEIEWENICLPASYSQWKTKINILFLFLTQLVLLLLYFAAHLSAGRNMKKPEAISNPIGPLMLLSILSYAALPSLVALFQGNQRSYSLTMRSQSMTNKLSCSFFLIRALIILAVEGMFIGKANLAGAALDKIVLFCFCDLIVGMVYWLVNPIDLIKRVLMRLSAKKNQRTQEELNKLYQRPSHNVPFKFSFLVCSFWTACFYSNLAPIILLVQFVALGIFYWIDKLNLAKRSSVTTKRVSIGYVWSILELFEVGIIFKPLGNLLFWSLKNQTFAVPELIMFIIAIIYTQAPKDRFASWIISLMKLEAKGESMDYNENNMDSLYRTEDPIKGGLVEKLKWMEQRRGVKLQLTVEESQISNNMDSSMPNKMESGAEAECPAEPVPSAVEPQIGQEQEEVKQTERNMVNQEN